MKLQKKTLNKNERVNGHEENGFTLTIQLVRHGRNSLPMKHCSRSVCLKVAVCLRFN